ncbi:MAG: hypothetical protein ACJ74G_24725 [Blastocatellia bacterium]
MAAVGASLEATQALAGQAQVAAPLKTTRTISVGTSADFKSALLEAQPGDQILLAAGIPLVGNFTLPSQPAASTNWITIRSAAPDESLPPADARVTPDYSNALGQLVSPNAQPALSTEAGAHHYRFIGVEFTVTPEVTLNYGVVRLGNGDETDAKSLPHDLAFDRCYIHGHVGLDVSRGIALNSAGTDITNCYLSDIHGVGFDTQAICGWNGPGPFRILNNYLEAAGENVMFGGVDPTIPDLVPSDIEFRRNDCRKPLAWSPTEPSYAGVHWSVKNLFELKNARRVIVDGNLFENNWVDAQVGFAIQLTVRNQDGKAPWSTLEDVVFTNNLVRHAAGGINILGRDNNHPSRQADGLLIRNNLFYDIGTPQWGSNGRFLQISGAVGIRLDHNTALQTGNIITAYGEPTAEFGFTNNLVLNNDYGVIGDGAASGNATIEQYLPASTFKKNAIIGGQASRYPKKNLFPASMAEVGFLDPASGNFRLSASSPLKGGGTKGQDIGADLDAIEQAHGASRPPPQ